MRRLDDLMDSEISLYQLLSDARELLEFPSGGGGPKAALEKLTKAQQSFWEMVNARYDETLPVLSGTDSRWELIEIARGFVPALMQEHSKRGAAFKDIRTFAVLDSVDMARQLLKEVEDA